MCYPYLLNLSLYILIMHWNQSSLLHFWCDFPLIFLDHIVRLEKQLLSPYLFSEEKHLLLRQFMICDRHIKCQIKISFQFHQQWWENPQMWAAVSSCLFYCQRLSNFHIDSVPLASVSPRPRWVRCRTCGPLPSLGARFIFCLTGGAIGLGKYVVFEWCGRGKPQPVMTPDPSELSARSRLLSGSGMGVTLLLITTGSFSWIRTRSLAHSDGFWKTGWRTSCRREVKIPGMLHV